MITFIFSSILVGFFVALIVGTLGDEIRDAVFRFSDAHHHPDPLTKQMRHLRDGLRR